LSRDCTLAAEAASKGLKRRVQALRAPIEAIRRGDPDGVHDMRVASRRLRALLREQQDVFVKRCVRQFRNEVRDVTRVLGTARELDVTLDILAAQRKRFHGPARHALGFAVRHLRAKRAAENEGIAPCIQWVSSAEFDHRLMELFENLRAPRACLRDRAIGNLTDNYHSLCRLHDLWEGLRSDEILHRIRIRFKQLRYACEVYEPLYGEPMKAFLEELKTAQEALGAWNDYRVLCTYLAAATPETPPRAAEGAPALLEAFRKEVERYLREFRASAQTFFSPEKMQEVQEFLKAPEKTCCRKKRRTATGPRRRANVAQAPSPV